MLAKGLNNNFYDNLYSADDRTYERPLTSPYYPLYCEARRRVVQAGMRSVLEVGCGSGVLGEMLIAAGVSYSGFDFSSTAVAKARLRSPGGEFNVADATDPASYRRSYDGIVCCEVLEHIDGDLEAIGLWKSGAGFVCSVPNFDGEHHVRYFHRAEDVVARYGALLDIRSIARIAKSARANLSAAEYFRRIRWARNEPRRLLGILGIKTFAWYGGWFVFAGRRR
ncbi:MAG: class I SAM-dependent DNA methyltransferase [Pseudomonadota bacterium]